MTRKKKWIVAIGVIIILLIVGWFAGTRLTVKQYEVSSTKITKEIKLVQLSDLHFSEFGDNNSKLISKVSELKPDVIAITGDLFDKQGDSVPKSFIKQLTKIAPVYFSPGNHEYDVENAYETDYKPFLEEAGVVILEDETATIDVNGQKFQMSGLRSSANLAYDYPYYEEGLAEIKKQQNPAYYQVLLSHMPDYFELYVDNDFDLTLSGHTHGGIVRIPFTNIGAIAPGPQRLILPEYVYGKHTKDGKTMIISAGLGAGSLHQKAFPRLGNPYEIVEVMIKPEKR
ncbi:metallophosphoesterase [Listeria ivanovii]|uniref:Calcineurin-like phosphoesterase domain-containing protein n=1 Tax=Listeria ivanovii (strain ATCC BAA-678 / PAM 55) TaxID=881621 RepID=G2ZDL1_LISIP|nr:metallophosphoesterase [Listeria ivanovii]AHI56627.1 ser/threonine protein phosphatase [Listeria ivanovii WSLC3009]AIS66044.1 serine/threonine protein phosphatase [Listeria ivanovii subsp. ivanovii]MBC1760760.1 metallophosphoesterase [Listeria ivanovii]MCJ1716987.1 metallophosphoesterase [Listeria ivanovii]MCJ1722199.1 metallophosphoesterase [Listeria ivanovii]